MVAVAATSETRFEVQIERAVPIPMRDGTILRADVYRPAAAGRFPVLLERVGYELGARVGGYGPYYAERGFVVVGQNVRGAFASDGDRQGCVESVTVEGSGRIGGKRRPRPPVGREPARLPTDSVSTDYSAW